MKLGVIADDFTGATDIAGFLVENGLATLQFSGIPAKADLTGVDAVVISLKSRSCP
ncbi:MAG: four-carbon acid sugar kinase family protein, partial [Aeromonas sp.]|nr:four-carbon acid sugar kinase family protein [Aeromonas sp.]